MWQSSHGLCRRSFPRFAEKIDSIIPVLPAGGSDCPIDQMQEDRTCKARFPRQGITRVNTIGSRKLAYSGSLAYLPPRIDYVIIPAI